MLQLFIISQEIRAHVSDNVKSRKFISSEYSSNNYTFSSCSSEQLCFLAEKRIFLQLVSKVCFIQLFTQAGAPAPIKLIWARGAMLCVLKMTSKGWIAELTLQFAE